MVEILMLFSALVCSDPVLINKSNEPWNFWDMHSMERAKKGCEREYPNSPCLKKFIKTDTQIYQAICGAESNE